MHVHALIKLRINIRNKGTFLFTVSYLHLRLSVNMLVCTLIPITFLLKYLICCFWQLFTIYCIQFCIMALQWRVGERIHFKWSWIQLPERILFKVFYFTKIVCFLALASNLLWHHFNIYLLGYQVGFLELVSDEIVSDSVRQLERARRIVVVLREQQILPLVLLLSYLTRLALI